MDGSGNVSLESGVWEGTYATPDVADATNPEELLAAGHASCFAMTMAYVLTEFGFHPERVDADATVTLEQHDDGFDIPSIALTVDGTVPDATEEEFVEAARTAEQACPVSKALAGTEIELSIS